MDCLIIDDDADLASSVKEYFEYNSISSISTDKVEDALRILTADEIGCILLDINFPNTNGYEICKRIRENNNLPIIFISSRRSDEDIITALVSGGDDYIKKPFSLSVLTAKIKAVLKRFRPNNIVSVKYKDLEINSNARTVIRSGVDTQLNNMEFKLFSYLFVNKGKVMDKYDIIKNVWGEGYYTDSTLNVYIRRLREKLEVDPNNPEYIRTAWGVGYKLV